MRAVRLKVSCLILGRALKNFIAGQPSKRQLLFETRCNAASPKVAAGVLLIKIGSHIIFRPGRFKNAHFRAHFDVILAALFRSENIGNPSILLHF